jgi:hypothetical protein
MIACTVLYHFKNEDFREELNIESLQNRTNKEGLNCDIMMDEIITEQNAEGEVDVEKSVVSMCSQFRLGAYSMK